MHGVDTRRVYTYGMYTLIIRRASLSTAAPLVHLAVNR